MMRTCRFLVATAALVFLGVAASSAQTLADVARKEGERRKALGKTTKVYTNDDMKSTRPLTTAAARPADKAGEGAPVAGGTSGTGQQTPTAGAPGAPAAGEGGEAGEGGAPPETPQAKLTRQAAELKQQVTRDRLAAEALQSRANALQYQAEQISDATLKAQFAANRDVIVAELEQIRREAAEKSKALAEVEDKLKNIEP